jgi:CRISPR-associated protein Cas2
MRNVFLVCYDVADDKRLRQTYKKMCGYGDPLQYSVFRCELSATEKQLMKEALWAILNLEHDRVMLVNLGPTGTRGRNCVEFWGHPRVELSGHAAVVV